MHGNDVRPVKSKITHSEKVARIACKLIKDVGNKEEKTNTKNQRRAQNYHKIQMVGSQ